MYFLMTLSFIPTVETNYTSQRTKKTADTFIYGLTPAELRRYIKIISFFAKQYLPLTVLQQKKRIDFHLIRLFEKIVAII